MGRRFVLVGTLLANLVAINLVLAGVVGAATTVSVTPTSPQGWTTADTRPGGAVEFVADTPPQGGTGALRLTTDATNAAKAQYIHATNVPLSTITELSYWTRQVAGPAVADPSYQVQVDLNGAAAGGVGNLVYEPYWNGTPTAGVWEQWDVDAGQFWSSQTFSDGGTCTVTSGAGGPPFYTLAGLKTACPNAVVVGFGVNIGTYNPSYDVRADLVDFNGTVYDFEQDVDLALAMSAAPNPVTAGANVTYTITVVNNGPGNASATVVSDTLPANTTFASCAASNGGACGGSGNARTVTFGSLPAGTAATIILAATVDAAASNGATLSNTATITAAQPDPNGTNNTATATTMVANPPAPTAPAATLSRASVAFGDQPVGSAGAPQSVTVTNTGTAPLTISNVALTGANTGDFVKASDSCTGTTVAVGSSCAIGVAFAPTTTGARGASLTIIDNAASSPQTVALSGTGTTPAGPSFPVTVTVGGAGSGTVSPGTGTYSGTVALTAAPAANSVFVGWVVDGTFAGFGNPLNLPVTGARTVRADFAPRPAFTDVATGNAAYEAITQLAARGFIRGTSATAFDPGNTATSTCTVTTSNGRTQVSAGCVVRAQAAALIGRTLGYNPGSVNANPFPDRCDPQGQNCIGGASGNEDDLWGFVATLANNGLLRGYPDAGTCQAAGTTAPCYLPRDPMLEIQVVSVITRAMVDKGYWTRATVDTGIYANVPSNNADPNLDQRFDLVTFVNNAGALPGLPTSGSFTGYNQPASRAFFAQLLWQAYSDQFSTNVIP